MLIAEWFVWHDFLSRGVKIRSSQVSQQGTSSAAQRDPTASAARQETTYAGKIARIS
jgi:hypothetical protein